MREHLYAVRLLVSRRAEPMPLAIVVAQREPSKAAEMTFVYQDDMGAFGFIYHSPFVKQARTAEPSAN